MERLERFSIHPVAVQQLVELVHWSALTYLLHFSRKIGNAANPRAMAQHYTGWGRDVRKRVLEHMTSYSKAGAIVWSAYHEYKVDIILVRVWPGAWHTEKWLKGNRALGYGGVKRGPSLCPCCNPTTWHRNAAAVPDEVLYPDAEDFGDAPISSRMDRYEAFLTGQFRRANIPPPRDDFDDGLI